MADTPIFIIEEVTGDVEASPVEDTGSTVKEETNDTQECFSRLDIDADSKEEEVKARNFVTNFLSFVKSQSFFSACDEIAKSKGIPKQRVATNFFEHVLGTISDVLHIAVDTIQDVVVTTLDILNKVLSAGATLLCSVAKRLTRVITLNNTCVV